MEFNDGDIAHWTVNSADGRGRVTLAVSGVDDESAQEAHERVLAALQLRRLHRPGDIERLVTIEHPTNLQAMGEGIVADYPEVVTEHIMQEFVEAATSMGDVVCVVLTRTGE